jgi:hypothetical protein
MLEVLAIILVVITFVGGGIATLKKGMIRATRNSVVEGPPARVIGWLLLLAIPLPFCLPLLGCPPLLGLCLPLLGCPLVAVAIGFATAKSEPRRPKLAPDRPSFPGSGSKPGRLVDLSGESARGGTQTGDLPRRETQVLLNGERLTGRGRG